MDKYATLCKEWGVKWDADSPALVDETTESLLEKFVLDPHLNNVSLVKWDSLAVIFLMLNRSTGLTLAEAVCMQKYAASLYISSLL